MLSLKFFTSKWQFFKGAFVIISKSIGSKTRGCEHLAAHRYKNQKLFTVLDTFPHIMSLNLVLKGERYILLQNFKSDETVLPSHYLNDWKIQLYTDKVIHLLSQNCWRLVSGKMEWIILPWIHCDANHLLSLLLKMPIPSNDCPAFFKANSEMTLTLSIQLLQWFLLLL